MNKPKIVYKRKCECGNEFQTTDNRKTYCSKKCAVKYCSKIWFNKNKDRVKEYTHNYQKEYYKKNKQKVDEKNKKWFENNREKAREYNRKYYHNNTEKVKERKNRWLEKNPNYYRDYCRKNKKLIAEKGKVYYRKNKDKIYKRVRANEIKNIDRYRAYGRRYVKSDKGRLRNQRRRIMEKNIKNDLTEEQYKIIKERDKNCVYCKTEGFLTLDHIISINKNGSHSFFNIVMACSKCNKSKRDKDVIEWCKSKGYEVSKIVLENLMKMKGGKV